MFALRFRANVEQPDGSVVRERIFQTLGGDWEGWTRTRAEEALEATLLLVKRGLWSPPVPSAPAVKSKRELALREFASEWFERRRREVRPRTTECWTWALSHILEDLGDLPVSAITAERVDAYRTAKVAERERRSADLVSWRAADPAKRGQRPRRGLSNGSINRTLRTLALVLDDAADYGYIDGNPARGKRRRLRAEKPRRYWLEIDEVRSLIDAAGPHRALLMTMLLTGLRIGEICSLRWRAVDLARARLTVEEAKTPAGERTIELVPLLVDELTEYRAERPSDAPHEFVFTTTTGRPRDRHNVSVHVLRPTLERANKARSDVGLPPIEHVTNHSCRRTFASLLFDAGATPPEVMAQLGHQSAALALEVYARKMSRDRGTGERLDALIRGAE